MGRPARRSAWTHQTSSFATLPFPVPWGRLQSSELRAENRLCRTQQPFLPDLRGVGFGQASSPITITDRFGKSTREPMPNVVRIWLGRNFPDFRFSHVAGWSRWRPFLLRSLLWDWLIANVV